MKTGTALAVQTMCQRAGASRAGFYRYRAEEPGPDPEALLRQEVRQVAEEWGCYGSRRVTGELRKRGWKVNRKRVQRLLREEGLRCEPQRKFVVTSQSDPALAVYPNLAQSLELTGIGQLWVADITYIRLQEEFVYLAVILDAYSRRVIGWALERTLEASLTLAALDMALEQRQVKPGLVHHSDRGSQYASGAYTQRLKEHGIRISMSRKATPWDNAVCESFMKTVKYEEVYRSEYRDLADVRARMGEFLEAVYNQRRLHSALHYCSPVEFERGPGGSGERRSA